MIQNKIVFEKKILKINENMFNKISNNYIFENITNGRLGTTIVDINGLNTQIDKNNIYPIVRTTTIYNKPFQTFNNDIYNIIKLIKQEYDISLNNALLEIYDNNYRKMKYHSDQLLDIKEDSYICIYSCYNKNVSDENKRKLITKNKKTNEINEIILDNNSIVIFDTNTNKEYLHKIILNGNDNDIKWLGLTFRLSDTFIKHIDNKPYFVKNGLELVYNNNRDFYKMRNEENKNINYKYPDINYSISPAELMFPLMANH